MDLLAIIVCNNAIISCENVLAHLSHSESVLISLLKLRIEVSEVWHTQSASQLQKAAVLRSAKDVHAATEFTIPVSSFSHVSMMEHLRQSQSLDYE